MTTRQGATLDAGLLRSMDQGAAPVGVAVVCRVVAYDPGEGTADVLPMVQARRVVDGVTEAVPAEVIYGCPVVWPSAGGRTITWGLAMGDLCLCVIRDRSHDEIDSGSAGPLMPAAGRRFNASDAVVLPGYDVPGSLPSSAVRSDGQMVVGLPAGEALHVGASTASRALALAEDVDARLEELRVVLSAHTHGYQAPTGGSVPASTTTVAAIPAFPSVASTRIKADA